jgi:hypothetical protein
MKYLVNHVKQKKTTLISETPTEIFCVGEHGCLAVIVDVRTRRVNLMRHMISLIRVRN